MSGGGNNSIAAKLFMPRKFGGRLKLFSLFAVSLLALSSCGGGDGGTGAVAVTDCLNSSDLTPSASSPNQSNERITILNDEAELDKLITCKNETIAYGTASAKATKPGQAGGTARLVIKVFSLTLVAEALLPTIVGKAARMPGGVTLDDLTSGGTYTGTQHPYDLYRVEIDATGTTNTFQWSDNNGSTWQATGAAITAGVPQTLSNGVTVTFAADTGHTVGDYWNIAAGILQATSVSMITDKKAVVSYNMVDAPYLGAIQVYELESDTAFLKSQALFNDMDINAVSVSNKSDVYAVGSHESAVKPAVLDWLKLNETKLELPTSPPVTLPIELHSFAANSVIHDTNNNKIYVTDGNDGGLTVINDTTLLEDSNTALTDARWVEMEGTTAVVMQGGNADGADGQISVFDITSGAPTLQNTFGFTGADIIESKSTVEVVGGKAFIAAGSGGARIMSASTGTSLATIPIPTEAESGIPDPNNRVANAVSVDDDLMFISFGGAGVYVAQETSGKEFDEIGSEGPVDVSLLGKLRFVEPVYVPVDVPVDVQVSVNHVAYKGNYLFIAAGLGGLKIVRVDK